MQNNFLRPKTVEVKDGEGLTATATISEVGLELTLSHTEFSFPHGNSQHIPPNDVMMAFFSAHRGYVTAYRPYNQKMFQYDTEASINIPDGLTWRVRQGWDALVVVKMGVLYLAPWLDLFGFGPGFNYKHCELYEYLQSVRATHLISPPPSEEPVVEGVFEPEIVEDDFTPPKDSTAIAIVDVVADEPRHTGITGLGIRRFVRSGLSFARDVAVDVTSRTISRIVAGQ